MFVFFGYFSLFIFYVLKTPVYYFVLGFISTLSVVTFLVPLSDGNPSPSLGSGVRGGLTCRVFLISQTKSYRNETEDTTRNKKDTQKQKRGVDPLFRGFPSPV